jgi:hypothetical protein
MHKRPHIETKGLENKETRKEKARKAEKQANNKGNRKEKTRKAERQHKRIRKPSIRCTKDNIFKQKD